MEEYIKNCFTCLSHTQIPHHFIHALFLVQHHKYLVCSISGHSSRSTILTSPTNTSTLSSRVWLVDYLTLASRRTLEILYKNLARRLSLAVLPLNSCSCSHTCACEISSAQTRIIAYTSFPIQ